MGACEAMDRIYNFSAGPGVLPDSVLERIESELLNYNGTGLSILEIGYGSDEYEELVNSAKEALRKVLNIPQNYKILFIQSGVSTQYSAIPLNLLSEHKCADYVVSGQLSKSASIEAKKYGDIAIAASSAGASPAYSTVPEMKRSDFRPDADYVHMCFNDPVYGTKFHYVPDTGNIPLVADMSTFLLSEPIDVSKFAMIYANGQSNFGAASLTVVILRDDLSGLTRKDTPSHIDYKKIADPKANVNSPSAISIFIAKLVFEWVNSIGGLEEMKRRNERKASLIYDYLDSQSYYTAPVDKKCRSMMNVVFITGDSAMDKKFIVGARENGLCNLVGDDSVGGMRASIYNAMTYDGVQKLVEYMKIFAEENPKIEA